MVYNLESIKKILIEQNKTYLDSNFNSVIEKHNIKCNICDYIWKIQISSLLKKNPTKCPNCSKKKKIDILEVCTKYNYLILEKYINNTKKYKFKCKTCNNIKYCTVKNIIRTKCTFCSKKKLTINEFKEYCLKRNIIFLNNIINKKTNKYDFKCCVCNHKWMTSIKNIYNLMCGCPNCQDGKWEKQVREIFEELTSYKFIKIKPQWLINPKTGKNLELDGYCEELNLAFEYQGQQHFCLVKKFKMNEQTLLEQQYRDSIKKQICKARNVKLIIIPQIGKYIQAKDLKNYINSKIIE